MKKQILKLVICCALFFIGAEVKAQEYTFDDEEPVIKNTKTSSRRFIGIAPIITLSDNWMDGFCFEVYYTDRFNRWLGFEMGVNYSSHQNVTYHVQLQVSSKYFTFGAGPSYIHYLYEIEYGPDDYFGVDVEIKIHPLIFNVGKSNNSRVGLGYRFELFDSPYKNININTIFLFWEIGMPKTSPKIKNIFKGNEW